jgi:hypothetical protein
MGLTCTVGVMAPRCCTVVTCNYFRKCAHLVTPSISSRLLKRFRKPSMDRNKECTDGVLSLRSPWMLLLCLAPIAAWSCFSTARMRSFNFFISVVEAFGAGSFLVGWVDVSLS